MNRTDLHGLVICVATRIMWRILRYKYIYRTDIHGHTCKREFVNISFRGGSRMKGLWVFGWGTYIHSECLSSFCGVTWIVSVLSRTLLWTHPRKHARTPTPNPPHTHIYRVTQKTGTFEKPNKNWRNPRKKIYWQKLNHYNLPFKRQ